MELPSLKPQHDIFAGLKNGMKMEDGSPFLIGSRRWGPWDPDPVLTKTPRSVWVITSVTHKLGSFVLWVCLLHFIPI